MAHSLLAYLLIAIATLQVAFATVYYCDPPKRISYGSYKPDQSKYRIGDRVYFNCDDDYGLYGSSWAKCIYSKTYKRAIWSHKPPVCRLRVKCPKLDDPKYGDVKLTGLTPGSKAFHSCDRGFVLKGKRIRVCQKNGYWSGKPPVCIKLVLCPKLKLDYGIVKHSGLKPGSKALHICNRCYKLVGDKRRVCQKDGYWTGKPPVCKIIDCGIPPKPDYGSVSYKSTTCGSKAFHSCDSGYYLIGGSRVRICQTNGYWSGRTPKCIRRKH